MVLSDREILAALERVAVRITPLPDPKCLSSSALDLTLDAEIRAWQKSSGAHDVVCPEERGFDFNQFADQRTVSLTIPSGGFDLPPGGFVLGWTRELVQFPQRSRIAARVEGKSSLARLGLGVHVTAPTIHAGFGYDPKSPDKVGNQIQLEIFNVGPFVIRLVTGMRICQLIFEEVHGTPQKGYAGMFAQQGPAPP
ncbi:MAG TPA: dCTP deaminase [Gemmataceae bacterium]|nr:dCTP deaminase [Gemmataceae bacterium]